MPSRYDEIQDEIDAATKTGIHDSLDLNIRGTAIYQRYGDRAHPDVPVINVDEIEIPAPSRAEVFRVIRMATERLYTDNDAYSGFFKDCIFMMDISDRRGPQGRLDALLYALGAWKKFTSHRQTEPFMRPLIERKLTWAQLLDNWGVRR